jgi:hypothetical protein
MFGVPAAAAVAGATRPSAARTQAAASTKVFLTVANVCVFGGDRAFL